MKRCTIILGLILLTAVFAGAASTDAPSIPSNLRNNQYYLESVRLTRLAHQSYETGDYDASTQYAEEALRYAQLSDEWVALQLKIKETNDAIAAAKSRLDYADSFGAANIYPAEYRNATTSYGEAVNYRAGEQWDPAIAAAKRVLDFLAYIQAPPSKPSLPARYAVRSWAGERDCLWNIASRPWVYGDPQQWRTLYEANRSKLPESTNPDLIEPGMVLDIPSIRGEYREGLWDEDKVYEPLN
jgi:nucleoid-associated protein YgaU